MSARVRALLRLCLVVVAAQAAGCGRDFSYADGSSGRYADWTGKWVIINYWAEWCAPCRDEIPELNALQAARDPARLVVVGVNFDGLTGAELTTLVAKMGIEFPVLVDSPRARWGYPQPAVLPTSIVIRPDGAVAATLVGPQTRASFAAVISAPLAGQGAAGG